MLKKVYLRWIINLIYIHIHLHENNIIALVLFPISHHSNELLRYFSDILRIFFKGAIGKFISNNFFYINASIFCKIKDNQVFFVY